MATTWHGSSMLRKPDFFIVGAPKCGTTALYEYLRPHPNIFMPIVKEPHFFAKDLNAYPAIQALDAYMGLFAGHTEQHLRLGEASVYYLRSSVALPNLRAFNPEARILAMFRNPVDMVYALHGQLLYVAEETEPDFETAWRLQDRRRQGLDLPRTCREPLLVQYREVGQFGTQAERVLANFPPSQVKLILYDDFAASPQAVYDEVLGFLGVPHDGRAEFPRINESKRARITWLKEFMRRPPPLMHEAVMSLKQALGGEKLSALKRRVTGLNTARERRPPLSPTFRAELVESFRPEVQRLSEIMGRDLSRWI